MKRWHWLTIFITLLFIGWGLAIGRDPKNFNDLIGLIGRSLIFLAILCIAFIIILYVKSIDRNKNM